MSMGNRTLAWLIVLLPALSILLLVGCSGEAEEAAGLPGETEASTMSITLTSPVIKAGETIPRKYSCDGDDLSPALQWSNVPDGAESLVLIMDDPDAPGGTWVHWVVINLPADSDGLPENVAPAATVPGDGLHGNNSWRRLGYGGPCPPRGTHRYFFKLYALDTSLGLGAGVTKGQVMRAMEGHVLATGELMGTYTR